MSGAEIDIAMAALDKLRIAGLRGAPLFITIASHLLRAENIDPDSMSETEIAEAYV